MRVPLVRVLAGLAVAAALLPVGVASAGGGLPPIRHVFIIVLENKGFDETFGFDAAAPYLAQTLPDQGAFVPNYYGVTHESLGNYIAMVSGQGSNPMTQADCQIYENVVPGSLGAQGQALGLGCVYPTAVKTIADQLTAAGLTWKGYMEDMGNGGAGQPQTCRHPTLGTQDKTQSAHVGDQYAARHNPFVYFHSLIDTAACRQDDVPLDRLPADLRSISTTPNYSFITPNLCDDGHDSPCVNKKPGGLVGINSFLKTWVPQIVSSPAYRAGGMLAIVFDESDGTSSASCCGEAQFPNTVNNGGPYPGRGGGQTGAVVLSPFIDPGTIDVSSFNHFSLLRSVEDLFGLGHLGYAAASGLQAFGSELFTCYAPGRPRARRGRLPTGSEIKQAVIGQGTARRPSLELKLWHPGRVTVTVTPAGSRRVRRVRRGLRAEGACQLLKVRLPVLHGSVHMTASAFGGAERRTLQF